jgi:hypothetical protein
MEGVDGDLATAVEALAAAPFENLSPSPGYGLGLRASFRNRQILFSPKRALCERLIVRAGQLSGSLENSTSLRESFGLVVGD